MPDLFDELAPTLFDLEGEYSNNPNDSGGETKFGITKAVAVANGYTGDMHDLTKEQALAIYRADYWSKPGIYQIAPLSRLVAAEILEEAVNMGPEFAIRNLQVILNAFNHRGSDYPDITVDGKCGPGTVGAFASFMRVRGTARVVLKALNCLQGAKYINLASVRQKDEDFVYGQIDKRVILP